ncbi:MAG: class I SAM-dependent methyltransferase [Egibacteraceae bacterium]
MKADGGGDVERSRGLHGLLRQPVVYELFQRAVGSLAVRREIIERHLRPTPGDRLLDIGCGPADILASLAQVEYVGFDPSPDYIASARQRYGDRGRFLVATVEDAAGTDLGLFDVVLAKGVLHHVENDEAERVFALAHRVLRPGGRLVTLDPCWTPEQSVAARLVISQDRGRNIRSLDAYRALAQRCFADVTPHVRHDLLRIPYTHLFLECVRSERSAA